MLKNFLLLPVAAAIALPHLADCAYAKERKQAVKPDATELKRSLFSGSESRFAEFGWIRPDCTGPTADVYVVKAPAQGDIRLEEATAAVYGNKSELQKLCHGKPLNVIRLYYKATEGFVGNDVFVVDVDTKLGQIKRYKFSINIR